MTNPCRDNDNSGTLEQYCDSGALYPIANKVSWARPQDYIAFVQVDVAYGARAAWAAHVRAVLALEERAQAEQRNRRGAAPYVAAAHVVGSQTCNGLLEVMADDEETLLRLVVDLTDVEGILDTRVLRCDPGATRGFGETGVGTR